MDDVRMSDKYDADSMEMELAEVAEADDLVKAMAHDLAVALTTAYRMLIKASADHVFNVSDWELVEATVNRLIDRRGY